MSPELEEFLENTFTLRRTLAQVLPQEAIDYIINLIAKDGAHRKFIKLTGENEYEHTEDHADKEQN